MGAVLCSRGTRVVPAVTQGLGASARNCRPPKEAVPTSEGTRDCVKEFTTFEVMPRKRPLGALHVVQASFTPFIHKKYLHTNVFPRQLNSRLVREVADSCLQYWGGMGYTSEVEISRMFRDVRLVSIGAGADEVMLSIICKLSGTLPRGN